MSHLRVDCRMDAGSVGAWDRREDRFLYGEGLEEEERNKKRKVGKEERYQGRRGQKRGNKRGFGMGGWSRGG